LSLWPLALPLALFREPGMAEVSAGGAITVALVLGAALFWLDVGGVVVVTTGVCVLPLPPGRANTARPT